MPAISIIDAFSDLPDPRLDRTKRHQLSDILIVKRHHYRTTPRHDLGTTCSGSLSDAQPAV